MAVSTADRNPDLRILQAGGSRIFLLRYPGKAELEGKGIPDRGPSMHTSAAAQYIVIPGGRAHAVMIDAVRLEAASGDR